MTVSSSIALVTLFVFACGSSEVAIGDPPPGAVIVDGAAPLAEADFPAAWLAAYCDNLGPCCSKYGVAFDRGRCERAAEELRAGSLDASRSGRIYDPVAAGACVAATRRTIVACDRSRIDPADRRAASDDSGSQCGNVYRRSPGTKRLGERCGSTAECAAEPGREVECGEVCKEVASAGVGEPCQEASNGPGPLRRCAAGATCACLNCPVTGAGAPDFRCVAPVGIGVSCVVAPCDDRGFCGEDRSCVPRQGAGARCASDLSCADGLRCEADVCAVPPGRKADGAPCRSSEECASESCWEGVCFTAEMGIGPSTCAAPFR